jgi:hypothetical protein
MVPADYIGLQGYPSRADYDNFFVSPPAAKASAAATWQAA